MILYLTPNEKCNAETQQQFCSVNPQPSTLNLQPSLYLAGT